MTKFCKDCKWCSSERIPRFLKSIGIIEDGYQWARCRNPKIAKTNKRTDVVSGEHTEDVYYPTCKVARDWAPSNGGCGYHVPVYFEPKENT